MLMASTPAPLAHHIMHRDRRLGVMFRFEANRLAYLAVLFELRARLRFKLFAYCLMGNHGHLVVELGEDPAVRRELMGELAAIAGRSTCRAHRAPVSVEGRFLPKPIGTQCYLFKCIRYVERNPVGFKGVRHPMDYRWSSYRARMGRSSGENLDSAPCYLALGATEASRRLRYRQLIEEDLRQPAGLRAAGTW